MVSQVKDKKTKKIYYSRSNWSAVFLTVYYWDTRRRKKEEERKERKYQTRSEVVFQHYTFFLLQSCNKFNLSL